MHYGLAGEISRAERGFYGETWYITGEKKYFVKVIANPEHARVFAQSLKVLWYMLECGATQIMQPLRTLQGEQVTTFAGDALAVFAFAEGIHTEDYLLMRLFRPLCDIYKLPLPPFPVQREDFAASSLTWLAALKLQLKYIPGGQDVLNCLMRQEQRLNHYARRLMLFSQRCMGDQRGFFITHGDAGGNVILQEDSITIVDWDHILIAPPERDVWMFCVRQSQLEDMQKALEDARIGYTLRPQRLCYYAYYTYFYYLCELLRCFIQCDWARDTMLGQVQAYFGDDNWVYRPLAVVEKMG